MKHRTLRIVAYTLSVLAIIFLICGIVASIIIAVKAATPMAQVTFLLVGFIVTAINAMLLLGASKLIYLFLSFEEHLGQINRALKQAEYTNIDSRAGH